MTVRLFSVTIDQNGEIDPAWARVLSAAELAKAARFYRAEDRRAYAAAHALKRLALATRTGAAPAALVFDTLTNGKPVLAAMQSPCDFSLSHTAGCVAVAVGSGPVGVDVENGRRVAVNPDLALAALGTQGAAALGHDHSSPAWRDAFFAAWTLREAVVKADGSGLEAIIRVRPDDTGASLDGRRWRVSRWTMAEHHLAAACQTDHDIRHTRLDTNALSAWCARVP